MEFDHSWFPLMTGRLCVVVLLLGKMAFKSLVDKILTKIWTRPLPTPLGNKPMGYCITTFNHVQLPVTSLLGELNPTLNPRIHFLSEIWRIGVGSVCLTSVVIPSLKVAAYITAEYSKRRTISGPSGTMVPIISFRTQQAPIIHALSQAIVLEAFFKDIRHSFTNRSLENITQRNALSTIFKAVAIAHWRQTSMNLADRCGAQGLFQHNEIIALQVRFISTVVSNDSSSLMDTFRWTFGA